MSYSFVSHTLFILYLKVVFYVASVLVTLIATCTPRTMKARLPIFATMTASFILERLIVSFILNCLNTETPQISGNSSELLLSVLPQDYLIFALHYYYNIITMRQH